jgi:hypothetical protein
MHKQKVDVWVPWTPLPAISVLWVDPLTHHQRVLWMGAHTRHERVVGAPSNVGECFFPAISVLWVSALPRHQRLVGGPPLPDISVLWVGPLMCVGCAYPPLACAVEVLIPAMSVLWARPRTWVTALTRHQRGSPDADLPYGLGSRAPGEDLGGDPHPGPSDAHLHIQHGAAAGGAVGQVAQARVGGGDGVGLRQAVALQGGDKRAHQHT